VIGGLLVSLTKTAVPDLVLGLVICAVVVRGGVEIVRNAQSSASHEPSPKKASQETGFVSSTGLLENDPVPGLIDC